MNMTIVSLVIYGLLVAIGGLIGYIKAASAISLVAGLGFGGLIVFSAWAMAQGYAWAFYLAILLALFLSVFFGVRFSKSGAWMPAGLMTIASLIALVILCRHYFAG